MHQSALHSIEFEREMQCKHLQWQLFMVIAVLLRMCSVTKSCNKNIHLSVIFAYTTIPP